MGIIRRLHQKRPSDVRKEDEERFEPITTDKAMWKEFPDLLDVRCVDEPLPDEYMLIRNPLSHIFAHIEAEPENPDLMWEEATERMMDGDNVEEIHRELGGTAAYLKMFCNPQRDKCFIGALWVEPAFRGQCFANVLMREVTNFADKNKTILKLDAMPFEQETFGVDFVDQHFPDEEEVSYLADFYEEFGFERQGKIETLNDLPKQSMIRYPR